MKVILFSTNILRKKWKESLLTKDEDEDEVFSGETCSKAIKGEQQGDLLGHKVQILDCLYSHWGSEHLCPHSSPKTCCHPRHAHQSCLCFPLGLPLTRHNFQMRQKQKLNWVQLPFKKPHLFDLMTKYSFKCKIHAVAIRKPDLIQTCWKRNPLLDIYQFHCWWERFSYFFDFFTDIKFFS